MSDPVPTDRVSRADRDLRRRRRRRRGLRRLALLVAAVAALAATAAILVTHADGDAESSAVAGSPRSAAPSPPPVWVATAARPMRVWIGGDSLAGEVVWGLSPLLDESGAFRMRSFYKESSGICRYDYFDWRRKVASVMRAAKPDAVVFMVGTNDTQSLWTAGGWIHYGTPAWKTAYGRRVTRLMDTMLDGGARRVYWIGMPIMRDTWRNPRMRVINRVVAAQAEERPGVRFVDIWALFANGDGRYVARWRGPDGVHFSLSGARRLCKRVYRFIEADWLPPAASPSASGSPPA